MKNLKIIRLSETDNNAVGGISQTIEQISFKPEKGNKLDEVIYYLICAQEKLQSANLIENALASSRLDLALVKLKHVIADVEQNDTFFKKIIPEFNDKEESDETKL